MLESIIIAILVGLLRVFLESLLKKWLEPKPTELRYGVPPIATANAKSEYLTQVKRKWWLGPGRLDRASNLYDRMAGKFLSGNFMTQLSAPGDPADIAARVAGALCDGLTLDASKL